MEQTITDDFYLTLDQSEMDSKSEETVARVPRKRGRPPKTPSKPEKSAAGGDVVDSEIENAKPEPTETPTPRKRGRPRLPESERKSKPPSDGPKRGRGRPRKYPPKPTPVRSETGRGRGRPRKKPLDNKAQTSDGSPAVKRGRGRPKKSVEPEAAEDAASPGTPRSPLKVALKSVSAKLTKESGSDVERSPSPRRKSPKKAAEDAPKAKRGRKPKVVAKPEESTEESSD